MPRWWLITSLKCMQLRITFKKFCPCDRNNKIVFYKKEVYAYFNCYRFTIYSLVRNDWLNIFCSKFTSWLSDCHFELWAISFSSLKGRLSIFKAKIIPISITWTYVRDVIYWPLSFLDKVVGLSVSLKILLCEPFESNYLSLNIPMTKTILYQYSIQTLIRLFKKLKHCLIR